MSLPTSRLSYDDCIKLMDRAIADDVGARTLRDDWGAAGFFRLRCHKARSIVREDNREMHKNDPGHPLYGRSNYDKLRFTLEAAHPSDGEGKWWVYAKKIDIDDEDIESLSEIET